MNTRRSRSQLSFAILRTTFALCLALLVFLISCKHNSVAPALVYKEPADFRHSTLPLSVGNQWAYTDTDYYSLAVDPQGSTSLRLISIDSYSGASDHGWWRCKESTIEGERPFEYSIVNDTVYIQELSGSYMNYRIEFIPPSSQDTVTFPGPYEYNVTKVYALNHSMTTPAGTFDSVYVYESEAFGRTVSYFRPGIGLISREYYLPDINYVDKLFSKTTLVAFNIIP
jgi:hypothetical protein